MMPVFRRPAVTRTARRATHARPTLEHLEAREVPAGTGFLQGTVYVDANANGAIDPADTPRSGAEVQLFLKPNLTTPFATTTTGPTGQYLFPNLDPGDYRIVDATPGFVPAAAGFFSQLHPASVTPQKAIDVTLVDTSAVTVYNAPRPSTAETITFTLLTANPQNRYSYVYQRSLTVSGGGLPAPVQFPSFCVNVNETISPPSTFGASTQPLDASLPFNAGRVGYLYNHYGTTPLSDVDGAALQMAIWELEYDASPDITAGNFVYGQSDFNDQAIRDKIQFYLTDSAGKSEAAIYLRAEQPDPNGHGMQSMIATGSFNLAGVPVDAAIDITPNGVNEVGDSHEFTITVTAVPNGAGAPAFGTPTVSFSGATPGAVGPVTPVSVVGNVATYTVSINNPTAGTFTVNAAAAVTIGGTTLVRDTAPATADIGAGPGGSGPAVKTYVDARVSLAGSGTNAVNDPHTFTATVEQDDGLPAGAPGGDAYTGFGPVAAGQPVTITLAAGSGAVTTGPSVPDTVAGGTSTYALTTDAAGQATVTFNSATAGQVVGNAVSSVVVGGLTLVRDTAPATATIGAGPGGSGPATKTYVDARIVLTPASAVNPVNDPHVITAAVYQDDGLPAGAPGGDGVTGFAPAPNGTVVVFSLDNSGGATASFVGGGTAVVSGGTASVTINSPTAGLVTITGTTTFSVGGVALTLDTDPATAPTAGPGGGGPVTKTYVTPKIDIEKTTTGPSNSNPTAPDYDNEDAPHGPGVPVLAPGSTVTWTYKVTNTGGLPFQFNEVVVTDDNGTPATTADDLSTTGGQITFLSVQTGDADNILEPGEVWLYRATGTVQTLSAATGSSVTLDLSGTSGTSGSAGNVRTFTADGVSVKASAFSRDAAGVWSTAFLGSYGGGLGVTDGSEGDGSNNTHAVDNVGRDNYVLFEFNQSVVVDAAFLGYVVGDSDLSVWIGTKADPFNNHGTLSDSYLSSLGFTEVNLTDLTSARTADLNAGTLAGNVLVVAAWTGDDTPEDRFKIETVKVKKTTSGVYENKGTVTVPGATDSDLSHYRNPSTPATGGITGKKYRDVSGNGLNLTATPYAPADVPLAGTTIYLDLNNNGVKDGGEPAKVTNAQGEYSFTGLAAGVYHVREVVPAGFIRTGPAATDKHTVSLAAGGSASNKDFANYEIVCGPCTIANVSFKLVHADGTSEVVSDLRGQTKEGDVVTVTFWVDESGSFPITLVSYTAPDPFFDATTASQQAIYQLATGTFAQGGPHTLTVSIPNSYYQIDFVCGLAIDKLGPAGSNVFYTPQDRLISADNGGTHAPLANPGSIRGVKYNDANGNGMKDTGESGLKNWVIYVDANNNGVWDASDPASVTKADGSYTISNLAAGSGHKVKEVLQSGWTPTQTPSPVALTAGQDALNVDFGNKSAATPGSISGYKYNDRNADGEWDKNGLDNCWGSGDDEGGMSGWTIFVDYDKDGVLDANEPSDVTDANGYYKITGVATGTWEMAEVKQAGWIRTTEDRTVTLTSGEAETGVNVGNFKGSLVMSGDTATVNFWKGTNGRALIYKLNGGGTSGTATALGNWLAANFGEMYGSGCGSNTLAGRTNAQVYTYLCSLANNSSKQLEAQVLATVLAVYATDCDWAGGTYAAAYGFTVTSTGVKNDYFNVGTSGAAFGVVDDSALTVWDILQRANARASNGTLWAGYSSSVRTMAYFVFLGINQAGGINC